MRPGSENLVPYAVSVYAKNKDWDADDWKQIYKFAGAFSQGQSPFGDSNRVHGLWDSVKAARMLLEPEAALHPADSKRPERPARRLDRRKPAAATTEAPTPVLDEVRFAGVHADVGDTFDNDPRLARIALNWMVDGAADAGVHLKNTYRKFCNVTAEDASGAVHRMGRVWALLTYRRRPVLGARVHQSVRDRSGSDTTCARHIPASAATVDTDRLAPKH